MIPLNPPSKKGVAELEYEKAILCVDSLRLCVFARDKNHTLIQQRQKKYDPPKSPFKRGTCHKKPFFKRGSQENRFRA
jgi:hypothetical protein